MGGRSQLSGIPRVAEIIDATRHIKTACMTLRLDTAMLEERGRDAEIYARSLEHCLLQRVVTGYEVAVEPPWSGCRAEDALLGQVEELCVPPERLRQASPTVMRLVLNRRLLRRRGMVPQQVLTAVLAQHPELYGFASPQAAPEWVLRLRVTQGASAAHADNARLFAAVLRNTVVGGKQEIELAETCPVPVVYVDPESGALERREETAVETAGSALELMMLEPEIDWYRCTSNDVLDVYNTLGIEAARAIIFHELRTLVAGDSAKVSDRHIMMVATTMTHYGLVMPMSRHGINRIAETGPLQRASFEETSDVLTDAGIYGEAEDHMRGISQSIMMGRTPYIGTGCLEALRVVGQDQEQTREEPPQPSARDATLAATAEDAEDDAEDAKGTPTAPNDLVQSYFRGEAKFHLAVYDSRVDVPSPESPLLGAAAPSSSCGGMLLEEEATLCSEVGQEDETSMQKRMLNIMSRVPFEPPRSPRLVVN